MAALGLAEGRKIVVNQNSSVKELAASLNVTPLLERLLKSLECTPELEAARNGVEVATGCKKWLSIYTKTLQHAGESWEGFKKEVVEVCNRFGLPFAIFLFKEEFFLQLEEVLKSFTDRVDVRAAQNNEQTTEDVNYDAIIRSLIDQCEPHSIGYADDANGDLQNCFSSATVPQMPADEMVRASIFGQKNAVKYITENLIQSGGSSYQTV